jgi:hypothetical protein
MVDDQYFLLRTKFVSDSHLLDREVEQIEPSLD